MNYLPDTDKLSLSVKTFHYFSFSIDLETPGSVFMDSAGVPTVADNTKVVGSWHRFKCSTVQ